MRNRKSLAGALLCVLLIAGCTKQVHPKHPNQINDLDGYAYDSLTVAQASLDEAKSQLASGKFGEDSGIAKAAINGAGGVYDVSRADWLLYRDVLRGIQAGDKAALEAKVRLDLTELSRALKQMQLATGGK